MAYGTQVAFAEMLFDKAKHVGEQMTAARIRLCALLVEQGLARRAFHGESRLRLVLVEQSFAEQGGIGP